MIKSYWGNALFFTVFKLRINSYFYINKQVRVKLGWYNKSPVPNNNLIQNMTDEVSFIIYFKTKTLSTLFMVWIESIEQWNSYVNLNIILMGIDCEQFV